MHTKTMEGLIGARTNMELLNTPFRVYKEARCKGDTAMMEQAMGYMNDCSDKAYEYKEKADQGMKEDAEENRKIAEEQREEAIEKRKEEREELEKRIEESKEGKQDTDTVEISEEGKVLLKENAAVPETDADGLQADTEASQKSKSDIDMEPVIYTSTGEAGPAVQEGTVSVTV